MSLSLLKTRRYEGAGEGHLFELLGSLLSEIESYYDRHQGALLPTAGTMLKRVPVDQFVKNIEKMFIDLARKLFPTTYWLDKTPSVGMVNLAPRLLDIWPNSKFIFMKRRGIENIESKKRKFDQAFLGRCSEWAGVMQSWRAIRDELGAAAIEIEQLELAKKPEQTASKVAQHIGLEEQYLLRFQQTLMTDRPEVTPGGFATIYDFAELPWSAEEKAHFRRICGGTMDDYEYTYDRTYKQ
jgi:hypothetical protein